MALHTRRASWQALQGFGAALADLTLDDLKTPDTVFQIGVAPRCIDILTSIDGVEFDEAWSQRQIIEVEEQIFSVISRVQLLQNKKASGQRKD